MLSPEIIEELSILQDKVKPFAFVEVKKIIESDLDESIENIFLTLKKNQWHLHLLLKYIMQS